MNTDKDVALPVSTRILKNHIEIVTRLDRISNLWVAYHNSGSYPDDFGREFYHAVGNILKGVPLENLELFHIDASKIEEIVSHATKLQKTLKLSEGDPDGNGKGKYVERPASEGKRRLGGRQHKRSGLGNGH